MEPDSNNDETVASIEEVRDFLLDDRNYPLPAGPVEMVETHFAMVFLTASHAYKIKKPLQWRGIDFRSLASRHRHCMAEFALNRALAPDIYEGLETLGRRPDGRLDWGIRAAPAGYVIVMRRLPAELMLDRLIGQDRADSDTATAIAAVLARFHAEAPVSDEPAQAYPQRLDRAVSQHRHDLTPARYGLDEALLEDLAGEQREWLRRHASGFAQRAAAHRIREVHGDLRPEHICILQPPRVIDRLEFSRALRTLDVAEELAFLGLECRQLGAAHFAEELLAAYREASGDPIREPVWPFYLSQRATVRAKLCAWHLDDPQLAEKADWRAAAEHYLLQGLEFLQRA